MADIDDTEKTGTAGVIPNEPDLDALRDAAAECTACPLYRNATQTVFGEGPANPRIMFVGEQPGDAEDLAGHPFVGPAGKLLDRCIERAGIDRRRAYVTNAVKHFKWIPRGTRRIHSKPSSMEIAACFPWLEAELAAVKPHAPAAKTRLALDFGGEQHGMPVLTEPRDDMRHPERAEDALRPRDPGAEPRFDPDIVAHPYAQLMKRPAEGIAGAGAEPVEVARSRRQRPMAQKAAGMGGKGDGRPRGVGRPTDSAQPDDHPPGLRMEQTPVIPLHGHAMVARRIAEGGIRPRSAVRRYHRASEWHVFGGYPGCAKHGRFPRSRPQPVEMGSA